MDELNKSNLIEVVVGNWTKFTNKLISEFIVNNNNDKKTSANNDDKINEGKSVSWCDDTYVRNDGIENKDTSGINEKEDIKAKNDGNKSYTGIVRTGLNDTTINKMNGRTNERLLKNLGNYSH